MPNVQAVTAWCRRCWNVLRPDRLQHDLERELSFHVAERVDELQADGMREKEAVRQAQQQFGNFGLQIERTRDMDINRWLEAALRNIRQAARALAKTPTFTLTVVLTLALGIGANSAVFSAIDAVLLQPLPYPNADQLVAVMQVQPSAPPLVAPVRLEEWSRLNSTLQGITGYYAEDASELSGELPEKLRRAFVAPRFLQLLGIAPVLGRDFLPQEERFGGPNSVLISHRFWQRRFAGSPNALGATLRIGKSAVSIVGVLPASFSLPDRSVDIWSPSPLDAPYAQFREATWFTALGRLKPDVTLAQARADLRLVQANLGRQYPKTDATMTAAIEPLKEVTVGGIRRSLLLVFGSVSLLLLIACTNVAALLLSRATGRQQETSVRFSLGASRASVAAYLLTEVFLLAAMGALLGLFVAAGAAGVLRALAKDMPRLEEIGLDWRIVFYALACAMLVTLLCGILPTLRGTKRSLTTSLAQASRSQVSSRNPVQFVLVGVQVALAVVLLAGAGLLLRSFQELGRVSPGFQAENVLTFHVSSSWSETTDWKGAKQRLNRILDGLRAVPGVETAATAMHLPGVPGQYEVEVKTTEGRADSEPKMLAQARWVTPSYFATLRIPVVAGELCREQSTTTTVMVNQSFAKTYLAGSSAIGHHLVQPGSSSVPPGEIRGIVGDARETGLNREPSPTVYWCGGANQPGTFFLVRTQVEPNAIAQTIRRQIHELEPQRSVYDLTPLSDSISDAYADNRLRTVLLTFFALTAMSLACVGVYGTLSYLVNLRQREIALRLALGALRTHVVSRFLAQGLRVALLGCLAGLALAAAGTKLLAGMLYGVLPTDTVTLAGVVILVLTVSAIASLLPAVRAARLDSMRLLRGE